MRPRRVAAENSCELTGCPAALDLWAAPARVGAFVLQFSDDRLHVADAERREARRGSPSPPDTWAPLVDVGIKFMQTLAEQMSAGNGAQQWIETDARTGRSYLKLPVPEPAAVQAGVSFHRFRRGVRPQSSGRAQGHRQRKPTILCRRIAAAADVFDHA